MALPVTWLKSFVLACALAVVTFAVQAADLSKPTPLPETADIVAADKLYLERKAVLFLLRARFDDISQDDIAGLLAADAKAVATAGPSIEAIADLDSSIIAEGSYYIVSLTYLAHSGGALWPADKAEHTYLNDALAKLADLQARLFASVQDHSDPLPIFVEIDRVNAWTEGYPDLPASLDHFASRDALVAAALATARPVGT